VGRVKLTNSISKGFEVSFFGTASKTVGIYITYDARFGARTTRWALSVTSQFAFTTLFTRRARELPGLASSRDCAFCSSGGHGVSSVWLAGWFLGEARWNRCKSGPAAGETMQGRVLGGSLYPGWQQRCGKERPKGPADAPQIRWVPHLRKTAKRTRCRQVPAVREGGGKVPSKLMVQSGRRPPIRAVASHPQHPPASTSCTLTG